MSGRRLRQRLPISYYEPEEPNLDEYVYCDKCGDLVYEYCSIHGPLLVVPDTEVPKKPDVPSYVPRAALTIPNVFLHLAFSRIPEAGIGVFSTLTLPAGVRFGPYTGERTYGVGSYYCWQMYDNSRKASYCIDASDASKSNWMRYVNCARHWSEQNLVAYQYQGQLYYRTIKIVPRYTELLVFYGSEFANELDIDLGQYNSPIYTRLESVAYNRRLKSEEPMQTQEGTSNPYGNISSSENADKSIKNNDPMYSVTAENDTEEIVGDISENINNKNALIQISREISNSQINCSSFLFCDTCNEKFIYKDSLEYHMRYHDKNRPHECNMCTYRFTTLKLLNMHKFSKHRSNDCNLKIYKCEKCEKKYFKMHTLRNHLMTHTDEKPFECSICDAKFALPKYLRNHVLIHSDKQFSCHICNARFVSRSYLTKHIKYHLEEPFSCDVCGKKIRQKKYVKRHMAIHARQK